MDRKLMRISRFLSLVLRHKPETLGLSLDDGGWVHMDRLLEAANRVGVRMSEETLRQVVEQDDKKRFAFGSDGLRIRANYGHSVPVDLRLEPRVPPEFLYHGTATRFLGSIRRWGLAPRGRHYVHLSTDEPTAVMVGKRHGKPVVLTIRAAIMHERGYKFYHSESGIWLTEKVPEDYILFPAG